MRRRCNRTRIVSTAIEASLDRRCSNHRFQRGLEPLRGTLSRPSPHVYAQAQPSDGAGPTGPALVVSVVVFVGCDQSNHARERRDVEYLTKRARREDTTIGVTNDRTQRIARPAPAES